MFKIGNVLYKDDLVNHTEVEYIDHYKVDENSSLMGIDFRLPTLIVGWELTKKISENFEFQVSILNKETKKELLYWEFSFNEKKSDHVSGVDLFAINVPYYFFRKNYNYTNLDIIFDGIETIDNLKLKSPDTSRSVVYNYKNEMLYILLLNTIYGIDLEMCEYFNIKKDEVVEYFKQSSSKFIDDPEGSMYLEEYKSYPNFEELKRYLVVLLSKA